MQPDGGNIAIGTRSTPTAKLEVAGTVKATSFKVNDWEIGATPDYVFKDDYKLRPLQEVESFVKKNKHLPDVPSAKEMTKKGVDLAEMNMILLKKVEELTLYSIEQNNKLAQQQQNFNQQQQEIASLKTMIQQLQHK